MPSASIISQTAQIRQNVHKPVLNVHECQSMMLKRGIVTFCDMPGQEQVQEAQEPQARGCRIPEDVHAQLWTKLKASCMIYGLSYYDICMYIYIYLFICTYM